MKIYTRDEILDAIDDAKNDMNTFYASKIINYRGKTSDGVYYT